LKDAVEELQSKGMKAFVLDLRNNPGGRLSQAIQVADLFIEGGVIVSIKDREQPGRTWFAKREGTLAEFPMAVLVNRDTVAAAEIVAACLQDHERAIIVGERTYGKGTAHRLLELKGNAGALKLPTALFHRPNGKGIHRFDGAEAMDTWGVVPVEECEVNLSTEEYGRFIDYRRQRDVLRPDGPPGSDFRDRQLQKAIERL
jgi:carboxyl-terminal processing protease